MTLPAGKSRAELRSMYAQSWHKARERLPLTALEAMICDVITLHPEYQPLMQDPSVSLAYQPVRGSDVHNPFLHLGLHLAIREQISVDRPSGIRAVTRQLCGRLGEHAGEHAVMQVLEGILWDAQQSGAAPDEKDYLGRLRKTAQG